MGITITNVKIVGRCSKHRKKGDEIKTDCNGRVYEDEELSCIACSLGKTIEMEFKIKLYQNQEIVKMFIKKCEGKHIQQIAYSSYHDALTQICFGCKKVRTSLKNKDIVKTTEEEQ